MSDFDFLKEFGKNLDRVRPEHDFSETDWAEMEGRLDRLDAGKERNRWWRGFLFPFLACLGFLCMGGLLWSSKQEIKVLQTEIGLLKNESTARSAVLLQDTTVHHVSIIKYDTLYQTVVVRKTKTVYSEDNLGFDGGRNNGGEHFVDNNNMGMNRENDGQQFVADKTNKGIDSDRGVDNVGINTGDIGTNEDMGQFVGDNTNKGIKDKNSGADGVNEEVMGQFVGDNTKKGMENGNSAQFVGDNTNKGVTGIKNSKSLAFLPVRSPKPLEYHRSRKLPDMFSFITKRHEEGEKEAIVRRFRPHNAAIGLRATTLLPLTKIASTERSFTYGVAAEVAFGQNLHLIAGVDNGHTDFIVKNDDISTSGIPIIAPPTVDDMLERVEVNQPITDFTLGLRYDFRAQKRLRPMLSVAWSSELIHEQTFMYEFENRVTNEESKVLVPQKKEYFDAAGVQLGLGFNWFFLKNMSIGTEAVYQQHFSSKATLLHERIGLRAGLKYHF